VLSAPSAAIVLADDIMTARRPDSTVNPTAADTAYAAGIFDGEGSLQAYIGGGPDRTTLIFGVSVSQKNDVLLYWLKERFGGEVYRSKSYIPRWHVSTNRAVEFLRVIRPCLVVRGKDVDEVFQIYENRRDNVNDDLAFYGTLSSTFGSGRVNELRVGFVKVGC